MLIYLFLFILLFILAKPFYELAAKYDRNAWGYALVGIGTFLLGNLLFLFLTIAVILISETSALAIFLSVNQFVFSLLAGLVLCLVGYLRLSRFFETKKALVEQ